MNFNYTQANRYTDLEGGANQCGGFNRQPSAASIERAERSIRTYAEEVLDLIGTLATQQRLLQVSLLGHGPEQSETREIEPISLESMLASASARLTHLVNQGAMLHSKIG